MGIEQVMEMIPFEIALERVIDIAQPLGEEIIAFESAAGRVLAQDVLARGNAPAHDLSAMDGYAVRERDFIDFPAQLPVAGESSAGVDPTALDKFGHQDNICVRIFTGAPVPPGFDRIIIQENVERKGDIAHFQSRWTSGTHIRAAGSDFIAGDCLLPKGSVLTWRAMTTAAAADRGEVSVYRSPKVVILATGDELSAPGRAYKTPGHIPDSVSGAVATFAVSRGAEVLRIERIRDLQEALSRAAQSALSDADIVIVTGGASVGEKDYARTMFGETPLDYIFPKVAMKPGKPVWMAKVDGKVILGLPGNPSSALVTTRLFLAPLLAGLTGRDARGTVQFRDMVCRDALPAIAGRETFSRAYIENGKAALFSRQDSGRQSSLARADLLIRQLPHSAALAAGSNVQVLDF